MAYSQWMLRIAVMSLSAVFVAVAFSATPPASQPSTTQPATRPQVRRFTSITDILAKVPEELRPKATPDWYKYTEGKFITWVEEQMPGMTFDQEMFFNGCHTVRTRSHDLKKEWHVDGSYFYGHSFSYFGSTHDWHTKFPGFDTDEAGSKKWEAFKRGTRMNVTGVIRRVTIGKSSYNPHQLPKYDFQFELSDIEITPPK